MIYVFLFKRIHVRGREKAKNDKGYFSTEHEQHDRRSYFYQLTVSFVEVRTFCSFLCASLQEATSFILYVSKLFFLNLFFLSADISYKLFLIQLQANTCKRLLEKKYQNVLSMSSPQKWAITDLTYLSQTESAQNYTAS